MSSWWRRYVESLGVTPSRRSWRRQGIEATQLSRQVLADGNGGWVRRIVEYYGTDVTVGPWARRLTDAPPPNETENAVVHNGNPVTHDGLMVVHNG